MFKNYVIVIGGSAGGINALQSLLNPLPDDFPAAILIVVHIPSNKVSRLHKIISHYTRIPVMKPSDGMSLEGNRIYVAPPNFHMIIKNDKIHLKYGPMINRSRPAIDPLFFSAACYYGSHVIGIILSGLLDDGSVGLKEIKRHNGLTIIQSLYEAEYPDMPQNAAKNTAIDYCLPTADIASLLVEYVSGSLPLNI